MTKTKSSVMIGIIVLLVCLLTFGIGVSAMRSNNTAQAETTLSGSGTASDPYLIGTKAELETFRDIIIGANGQTRNVSVCARLTADIDLGGSESDQWTPIGSENYYDGSYCRFQGVFDGAGHTVSGLYINQPSQSRLGFFGSAQNATIKKLTVQGSITGKTVIGGILAYSYGNTTIYKCTNECTVHSPYGATGSTYNDVGGIIGYAWGEGNLISSCVNKGNVSTAYRTVFSDTYGDPNYGYDESRVAGILAFSQHKITIKNCVNEGDITGASVVAGIVAYCTGANSTITGCFNKGKLISRPVWNGTTASDCKCGGIAGWGYADISYCGNEGDIDVHGSGAAGIVAFIYGADYEVTCCYNTGNITGASYCAAGIADASSYVSITNCYNAGNITIDSSSNSFSGITTSVYSSTVSCVFNTGRLIENASYTYNQRGAITSSTGSGAAINHAYYLNNYSRGIGWYSNKSGPEAGCSSTALTAAQMATQSSFVGWDFDNVWIMDEDVGHPVLRHMHDYVTDADEDTDTITVACERPYGDAKTHCDNLGASYTLTLHAPTMARERDGGIAAATFDADELAAFNAGTGLGVSNNNVTYARREGGNTVGLGTAAPTTFGDYTAVLTVGSESVSINYTIEKLELVFDQDVLLNGESASSIVRNLSGETAMPLLDDEEIERYVNGESVNIYLEVTTDNGTLNIPTVDKTAAKNALETSGAKEGAYLDLSLFKQLSNDEERTAIHESETAFDITVDIPADIAEPYGYTRTYSIVRVHDGVAETLESTVENGKITFSTDRFSTYLIAYSDEFDEDGEYIEFTTAFNGESIRYIDGGNLANADLVTVTYKITHNDGFNSIVLIPKYDRNVFELTDLSVNNETVLGAATMTEGDGMMKILLENTGDKYTALDGEEEYFLTVTYRIIAAVNGEYGFGLVLTSGDENGASVAYCITDANNQKGDQTRVGIKVIEPEALVLIVKQEAVIEIGNNQTLNHDVYYNKVYDYFFTYGKEAVSLEKVAELPEYDELVNNFTVFYTYNGDAEVSYVWYKVDSEGALTITVDGNEYTVSEIGAPIVRGEYFVEISAPATDLYYAAETQYGYVFIDVKNIIINVEDKTSEHGDAIVELTYTGDAPFEGDDLHIVLSTEATSSSPVGVYGIIGMTENDWENIDKYNIIINNGIYTITKKTLTITALDQIAEYTGSEPEVDQTEYTVSIEGLVIDGVLITKEAGVNVGSYTLDISYENNDYDITFVPGTFTIVSADADVEAIKAYFEGLEKVYNGEVQNLLSVEELPGYVTGYTAENNEQKNVGTYGITVTVTVDENHNVGENDLKTYVFIVESGEITPAQVTVTANDVNVYYGQEPVIPNFTTEGDVYAGDDLDVHYVIKNGAEEFIPSVTTDAGIYDIVVFAGHANYDVTLVNGNYNVQKASASMITIEVSAEDVYYNRDLIDVVTVTVNNVTLDSNAYVVTYLQNEEEVIPVNAGEYTVRVSVIETDNYASQYADDVFEILKVKLEGVTFTYSHGNATWTAVENDIGKTADEAGTMEKALKDGVAVTYLVYDGNDDLIATIASEETRAFDALANTTYYVVATASDSNYLNSTSVMAEAYEVIFDEGDHAANPTGEIENLPAKQYVFDGERAVVPAVDPSVEGCTFSLWKLGDVTYNFTETVNGNITIVAIWDEVTYTITLKYLTTSETLNTDVFTMSKTFGETVDYSSLAIEPIKESGDAGIYYTFANKWADTANNEYAVVENVIQGFTVTEDMTFVAVFNTNYNSYTITYYFSEDGSTDYAQYGEVQENVVYGSTIAYRAFNGEVVPWFVADYWYGNEERTERIPARMPAEDISVYGTYKFDIGKGDVNASGTVTADDITLYRQWIVGGYEMTVVEIGAEWALVTGEDYDAEARYFLKRVADINADESKDIRDVSITRMALVGGYDWDITTGEVVSGQNVDRTKTAFAIASVTNGLNEYGRVRMYGDVTDATADVTLDVFGNIYLDLGGNTLTVNSLTLRANGKNAIITVKNGTIVSVAGITVAAPNGIVTIEDVTAYVDGSEINLQAADSSLHFAGAVEFYNGDTNSTTPATINVEAGTHVVVEETATVVVEKVVVTENFTAAPEASITIDNKTSNEVVVEGMIENSITTLNELIAAMNDGGDYVLGADIVYNGSLAFSKDTSINLNGHTLRSMNSNAMFATSGAKLVVSGSNGNVIAQEACVVALDGSTVIINGGNYTSYDNFVFGTNGTSGRGNNAITVNAGTFNGGIQTAGYVACGVYVANNDTVVVNGGTFNVTNGVGILARSGNTTVSENVVFNVTGDGHLGKVGDSKVTVPSGAVLVIDYAANYPGGDPVLTNDTAYDVYTVVGTVAELNAASGNVILGADIATNDSAPIVITGDMTLNLNGHTIASSNDVAIRVSGAQASLTIEGNGNVNAREGCVMAFYGASFVINGGTYTCTDNFVFGTNGTVKPDKDMGHNTITINAGTFNGEIVSSGYVACGIYVANSDTVVVNGGTFNVTNGVGILARSGNTTVNEGVVFNVTGDGHLGKVGDSKVTVPSGEALVHDLAANYPGGEPVFTNNTEYTVYTVNK